MSHFQVKLGGEWKDYTKDEDKILKRAFMAGLPTAKINMRGQNYNYDFKRMVQINRDTKKERSIRAPNKWKPPSKPLVPSGPTTVINVPPGAPGTIIQVPHPRMPGAFIAVNVPPSAKVGQAMLVPVPPEASVTAASERPSAPPTSPKGKAGWSTGAKVAAGAAGVAAVGGLAVGGVVLGEHIAEHGLDATVDAVGDGLADAGEAIGDVAVDAGEFIMDAGEDVGDFVMDLF
mmetsp:Transcript_114930/g.215094  ORF Transcript_114930/g.215094 Transcript_114930/m.215094 type:complete len:232 (-) Transcript_114930:207-902(-)